MLGTDETKVLPKNEQHDAALPSCAQAHYLSPHARQQAARLFNLLCIYAVHDPHLGYAQG